MRAAPEDTPLDCKIGLYNECMRLGTRLEIRTAAWQVVDILQQRPKAATHAGSAGGGRRVTKLGCIGGPGAQCRLQDHGSVGFKVGRPSDIRRIKMSRRVRVAHESRQDRPMGGAVNKLRAHSQHDFAHLRRRVLVRFYNCVKASQMWCEGETSWWGTAEDIGALGWPCAG